MATKKSAKTEKKSKAPVETAAVSETPAVEEAAAAQAPKAPKAKASKAKTPKAKTSKAKAPKAKASKTSKAAEAPVVEEPAAAEPVVEKPVAVEPVVETPVAAEPVVEKPVVEEPVAAEPVAEEPVVEEPVADKPAVEEPVAEKPAVEEPAVEEPAAEEPAVEEPAAEEPVAEEPAVEEPAAEEPVAEEPVAEEPAAAEPVEEEPAVEEPVVEEAAPIQVDQSSPRRSVAFIGSECYPFVKTGGLGDVMYALPKALAKLNCDVKVILPRYKCIPQKYQEKMIYRGSFYMDLCADGRTYYVGIMEYVWDGVVYDFIDNEEFFSAGNPYTNLVDDIPKYCYFSKAALAALNYMDWVPDIIHCHDWQAALIPVYLRTLFVNTKLTNAKTILTIHNLRFQGIYNIPTIRYWTGLPDYVFNKDALKTGYNDANMLKGGLAYANIITTVSQTYAGEIQSAYYGETLDAHLRYHSGKLRGIVNGIDYDIWNPASDDCLAANYDISDVLEKKRENKRKLQEELGLVQDENKFVIGLISRLTNQKGLDLVNAILPQVVDEFTQVVVLGSGDQVYEDSFRYYENTYKGSVCANIMYDEARSHRIYAGADALLVPSLFEPCGLTQLIAMHYGTIPIVRETGGLKDTVAPYDMRNNSGNGFTFDRYDAGLLLDAINRAKAFYFDERSYWDEMVLRDMEKDLSWENSAKQYKDLYLSLT